MQFSIIVLQIDYMNLAHTVLGMLMGWQCTLSVIVFHANVNVSVSV